MEKPVNLTVRAVGAPKLSLAQKLALFDPAVHGGEVMVTPPVGIEEGSRMRALRS